MARRTAHLCIGLPGALGARTTADLLAGHADTLAVAGHHLPASPETTRRAAWEITRDREALAGAGLTRRDVEGTWEGIWRDAYRARPRDVVLAEDGFAGATPEQAALALDALAGFRTHLVVVAADPADLLARAWTDAVVQGRSMPVLRFRDRMQDAGPGHEAARRWWAVQHLEEILERWTVHVPDHRVHVVVVSGDEQDRAAQAGRALGTMLGTRPLVAAPETAPRPVAARALPSTVHSAVRDEARRWADLLRASSYDVHGDPDDLVPPLAAGPAGAEVPAELSLDDRLRLTGGALADALAQLEGLRRENARLQDRVPHQPTRARRGRFAFAGRSSR